MSKSKKPNADRHKTKRRHVAIPAEWGAVLDALAATVPQQTTWYVIRLIQDAAKEKGLACPSAPWEGKKGK